MDKKFVVLMILFFVVFGVFVSSTLLSGKIGNFARASTETDPSSTTSLIFAWPLTTNTGNKVDINVFVRNANNLPLDKKPVRLVTNLGLINGARESLSESDKTGKVSFVLTSDVIGVAEITAFINGNIQLSQKVTVKFE
ncbi:MAG: hypothetical protein WC741_04585 [Patescibacteria group bacterium]|jgi:hypothetical protein